MNKLNLDQIKKRCAAATNICRDSSGTFYIPKYDIEPPRHSVPMNESDFSFYMNALTDIPALIAAVEKMAEALRFYGDHKNWKSTPTIGGGVCEEWICKDERYWFGCDMAKQTLEELVLR